MKKIQNSNESETRQVAFTCHLYNSRGTEIRQSNCKVWQICETLVVKHVKHAFHLVNFKKSKQ